MCGLFRSPVHQLISAYHQNYLSRMAPAAYHQLSFCMASAAYASIIKIICMAPAAYHQLSFCMASAAYHQLSFCMAPAAYHQLSFCMASAAYHQLSFCMASAAYHQLSFCMAPAAYHQLSFCMAPAAYHQLSFCMAPAAYHQLSFCMASAAYHQLSFCMAPAAYHQLSFCMASAAYHQNYLHGFRCISSIIFLHGFRCISSKLSPAAYHQNYLPLHIIKIISRCISSKLSPAAYHQLSASSAHSTWITVAACPGVVQRSYSALLSHQDIRIRDQASTPSSPLPAAATTRHSCMAYSGSQWGAGWSFCSFKNYSFLTYCSRRDVLNHPPHDMGERIESISCFHSREISNSSQRPFSFPTLPHRHAFLLCNGYTLSGYNTDLVWTRYFHTHLYLRYVAHPALPPAIPFRYPATSPPRDWGLTLQKNL